MSSKNLPGFLADPLLSVQGITKRYPGVVALEGVDFTAQAGEIHALVGANGAGKSTLMNILSGAIVPTEGAMSIGGKTVRFSSPADAKAAGVSTVYQEFSLVPQLSVARNIYLGREPLNAWGAVDEKKLLQSTKELFDKHQIDLNPRSEVCDLTVAQQQMVEIARALSVSSRILILDEPSAVLSLAEQEKLFKIMRALKEAGVLILYVSHRLEEIIAMADRLTVLRNGKLVATHTVAGLKVSDIVKMMVGGEVERSYPRGNKVADAKRYEITYRTGRGESQLTLHAGEVVGLAGLVGAGRTTFARALAGSKMSNASVQLRVDGATRSFVSPEEALKSGIVYLTEDRKRDGIFANLGLVTNASASSLPSVSAFGFMKPRQERKSAGDVLKRLRLVARDLQVPISTLSGGNQQKVLFGRAILAMPKLLICDEPTRGVDVGAKAEIHAILHEMADRGCAVLIISSEVDELMVTSSRIVVMRDYRFLQEFDASAATERMILEVASSGRAIEGQGVQTVH
ncbi:sugar ABC transporter ATP-binding protein [Mesorhizobium sp. SP-1A]|uniref:sugar ABC transporter ATP-binding protein n=1 Tax=Mesorhizobium sp. SP-1A TaxID=3077840 RepID=UPI0028F6F178|nr:sugar ABC transporter ATP-binding protein [Mesorhizobium sp. SP-1A]